MTTHNNAVDAEKVEIFHDAMVAALGYQDGFVGTAIYSGDKFREGIAAGIKALEDAGRTEK